MEKKNIDWENLDFGYRQTDKRFVANYKDGTYAKFAFTVFSTASINLSSG